MVSAGKYQNALLCDDIREEVGNKKSLMGILAGDVLVPEFPATIPIAVYFEYVPAPDDGNLYRAKFALWQGDSQIVEGAVEAPIEKGNIVTLALPRGLMRFNSEARLRLTVAQEGKEEIELLNKRVFKA